MRTLLENMKFPKTSLYESLLDDIDDLEKDSDDMVKWKTSIGREYCVEYVKIFNVVPTLKELDKQKIKKLTYKYNDGYKIYNQAGNMPKNPGIKYLDILVRCIMDLENSDSDAELESRINEFLKPLLKCVSGVKLIKHVDKISGISLYLYNDLYNGLSDIEISISKR